MKILAVTSRVPSPNQKGDQIVAYNRLLYLAKKNCDIELISFYNSLSMNNIDAIEELERQGVRVNLVKLYKFEAFLNIILGIFKLKTPLQSNYYKSKSFASIFNLLVKKFNPDFVYLVTIRPAINLDSNFNLLIDMIDSMGLNFSRRVAGERNYFKKLLLHIEKKRVSRFEKWLANISKCSFLVSHLDASYIGSDKVSVLPLGINAHDFFPKHNFPKNPTLIFSGNMNYQPNIEAILWFINNCWDEIRAAVPFSMLKVVGANPSSTILKYSNRDRGVFVTGSVESVAYEINSSHIAIAPMQSGSGMQFKILEAMACGVPVVATRLGLGDIAAKPGYEILLGDSADEFSGQVIKLLKSPALRSEVGGHSLAFVQSNHNWDAINQRFLLEISK